MILPILSVPFATAGEFITGHPFPEIVELTDIATTADGRR